MAVAAEAAGFGGVDDDSAHYFTKYSERSCPAPLTTEAIVLRSMRYGEADRILHLYTPRRGRVSAIAKGVRKAQVALRRPPGAVLPHRRGAHEGRSDLLTVTSVPTVAAHARLREHGAGARRRRARLRRRRPPVRHRRPASRASTTCSPTSSRCSTRDAAAGDGRQPRSPSGSSCCWPPASRRSWRPARPAARPSTSSASPAPRAASSARPARRASFRARTQAAHDFLVAALGPPAGRGARRRAPARSRQAERAVRETAEHHAGRAPRACSFRRLTQWVYDFSEGSRDMRDLLGGKGANVAEMTRVLGAERVPAGFTITTEACVAYMRDGAEPDGMDEQVDEALERLEEHAGKTLGDAERPAARLRALRRARVDARACSTRSSTSASTTQSVEGLAARDGQRALRVGLLPALRADVRQRRARHRRRALRGRDQGRQGRARRQARHRARRGRAARADRDVPGPLRLPAGPAGAAARRRSARSSTPGTGERAVAYRRAEAHPRRLGHRGQRPADGVRQQGRHVGLRRRLQPRLRHRRARPSAATSSSTRRARTSSPATRDTLDISEMARAAARGARASSMEIRRARSSATTATCRTSSSRRGGAALHPADARRQAPARRRPCASPATRSTRGCSTVEEALLTFNAGDLEPLLHRRFDPAARRSSVLGDAASAPRRARPRARSSSPPPTPCGGRGRPRRDPRAPDDRGPTTTPAWPPPRGILTREGGTARTRRSSRAGRAGRA